VSGFFNIGYLKTPTGFAAKSNSLQINDLQAIKKVRL
jgi:hypothetical protein